MSTQQKPFILHYYPIGKEPDGEVVGKKLPCEKEATYYAEYPNQKELVPLEGDVAYVAFRFATDHDYYADLGKMGYDQTWAMLDQMCKRYPDEQFICLIFRH
jgi:hypothetical protein